MWKLTADTDAKSPFHFCPMQSLVDTDMCLKVNNFVRTYEPQRIGFLNSVAIEIVLQSTTFSSLFTRGITFAGSVWIQTCLPVTFSKYQITSFCNRCAPQESHLNILFHMNTVMGLQKTTV